MDKSIWRCQKCNKGSSCEGTRKANVARRVPEAPLDNRNERKYRKQPTWKDERMELEALAEVEVNSSDQAVKNKDTTKLI